MCKDSIQRLMKIIITQVREWVIIIITQVSEWVSDHRHSGEGVSEWSSRWWGSEWVKIFIIQRLMKINITQVREWVKTIFTQVREWVKQWVSEHNHSGEGVSDHHHSGEGVSETVSEWLSSRRWVSMREWVSDHHYAGEWVKWVSEGVIIIT